MPPLAPGFLLATPTLLDPNFVRTVVLMFHHDERGALGIVVNRPTKRKLGEVLKAANLDTPDRTIHDLPIMAGGPVLTEAGWLIFEGDDPLGQSFDLGDGLRATGSIEVFKKVIERPTVGRILFALGYAGWAPGQLDSEMEAGAWQPCPLDRAMLFDVACEERWRRCYLSMGIDPNLWAITPGEC